jgi:hypothetical protein
MGIGWGVGRGVGRGRRRRCPEGTAGFRQRPLQTGRKEPVIVPILYSRSHLEFPKLEEALSLAAIVMKIQKVVQNP